MLRFELLRENPIQFIPNRIDSRMMNKILLLERIHIVVIKQPGPLPVMNVCVPPRAEAPVFFPALVH